MKPTLDDPDPTFINSQPYCGGTILNEYTILSAGHCSVEKGNFIVAGTIYRDPLACFESDVCQKRYIKKVITHPEYNDDLLTNDICILKLYKKLNFKKNLIGNACLPKLSFATPSRGVVSGWGTFRYGMYRKVASINKS